MRDNFHLSDENDASVIGSRLLAWNLISPQKKMVERFGIGSKKEKASVFHKDETYMFQIEVKKSSNVLDFSPAVIAKQLTLKEFEIFRYAFIFIWLTSEVHHAERDISQELVTVRQTKGTSAESKRSQTYRQLQSGTSFEGSSLICRSAFGWQLRWSQRPI